MPWASYSRAGTEFSREVVTPRQSCYLLRGHRQSELEGEPSGSAQHQRARPPMVMFPGSRAFLLADDIGLRNSLSSQSLAVPKGLGFPRRSNRP